MTFLDVVNRKWGWPYAAFYTTGAILCNSAYQKGGVKLVNELLKIPNDSEKLVENLCLLFDIEKEDFDGFAKLFFTGNIEQQREEYSRNPDLDYPIAMLAVASAQTGPR